MQKEWGSWGDNEMGWGEDMDNKDNCWTIHKQIIQPNVLDGYWEGMFPLGARMISTAVQNDKICIWYKWDLAAKEDEVEKRAFIVVGTGWETNYDKFRLKNYLGTVQLMEGSLVFHVFEVEVKKED